MTDIYKNKWKNNCAEYGHCKHYEEEDLPCCDCGRDESEYFLEQCTLGNHCLHYMEGDGDCCDCGEKLVFCENCGWVEISGEEHMDKWGC